MSDKTLIEDLEKELRDMVEVPLDARKLLTRCVTELKRREWKPISETPKDEKFLIFTEEAQRQGGAGSYHQDSKICLQCISTMWWINQMDSFDRRYVKRFMDLPDLPEPPQSTETNHV